MSNEKQSSDISNQNRLLSIENARLKARLEAAEKSKTEYMQNVAHQLAAPINAIKMNIDTLKNPKVVVARKQVLLKSIYCQGTILAHLIKNFSFMSQLDAEHNLDSFREKPEEIDLYGLCVNFVNDFQPIGAFKDQKIVVHRGEFERLGMPCITVIKNLFSQVLYNLLENATKYAKPDTEIAVGLKNASPNLALTVRSEGTPISASDAVTIFNRGERGAGAKALNPAGTGFGLYIARRIVEIHHGRISVEPNGPISIFSVEIPRKGDFTK